MTPRRLGLLLATLLPLAAAAAEPATQPAPDWQGPRGTDAERPGKPGEDAAARNARLSGFRQARFGMFVHWGLYAQAGGRWKEREVEGYGEWLQANARIPAAEYERLAEQFNPVDFDAGAWVAVARAAGMSYLVFTAKHHDGFAMFDSQADDYNIVARSPWRRDPLAELARAAARAGLPLGIYYSQNLDWRDPDARGNDWEPGHRKAGNDFNAYMQRKALPQLRELLDGRYGPVAELWWDYPADANQAEGDAFRTLAWSLQPQLVMNDRGGGRGGDFSTPEQAVPSKIGGEPDFEVCMTLNDTWGYRLDDTRWKSAPTLLGHLVDTVSQGGNFLLNVGPDARGRIPAESVRILGEIGAWMQVNGEAIQGARRCPLPSFEGGRCTVTPGRLYLFVQRWPQAGKLRVPMPFALGSVRLLGEGAAALPWTMEDGELVIDLPIELRDAVVPVVSLSLTSS